MLHTAYCKNYYTWIKIPYLFFSQAGHVGKSYLAALEGGFEALAVSFDS